MFNNDFLYNFAPKGFDRQRDACCEGMADAFRVGGIDILSNYKHVIVRDYVCLTLEFCPWCAKDLRPMVTRDRPAHWPGSKNNRGG